MGAAALVHYAVSALGPVIVDSLDLTATQFGALWLVTFAVAGLFTVSAGRAVDRVGARTVLLSIFLVSTVALLLAGGARSYEWLLVALGLSGVALALSNPATNRLIAASVATRRQGLVVGVKQSGVQMSQFFAGLVLPSASLLLGWRAVVALCSLISVGGLMLTTRQVPREMRSGTRPHATRQPLPPTVWWLTAYSLLAGAVIQATNVYLPLYAHQELGASVTTAGLLTAVLGGFGVLARFAWGSGLGRVHDFHLPLLILAVVATAALAVILLAASWGAWLVWVGSLLFSLSALSANVVLMLAVVRTVAAESIGRSTGWVLLGQFLGYMGGPLCTGLLVDHLGYATAWSTLIVLTTALFLLTLVWRRTHVGTARAAAG